MHKFGVRRIKVNQLIESILDGWAVFDSHFVLFGKSETIRDKTNQLQRIIKTDKSGLKIEY